MRALPLEESSQARVAGRRWRGASKGDAWTAQQAADLWDRHGTSTYALACALLCDKTAAIRAVIMAMQDLTGSTVSTSLADARGALSRYVYWRSRELTGGTAMTGSLPPTMVSLSRLADLQRTCLALCVFGGQTHQEAADLLGVPSSTVARMLTSGLRELSRPAPHRSQTAPA